MRKILGVIFCLFIFLENSFAEWNFFIPLGFNYSNQSFEAEETSNMYGVKEYFFDLGLYAISENGFTIGGKFDLGGGNTSDLYSDGNKDTGMAMLVAFDIGWAPVKADSFSLALCGNFSFYYDNFKSNQQAWTKTTTGWGYSYDTDYTYEESVDIVSFSLGGTICAFWTFWDVAGLYFSFNLSKVLGGSLMYGDVSSTTTYDGERYNYGRTTDDFSLAGDIVYNFAVGFVFKI